MSSLTDDQRKQLSTKKAQATLTRMASYRGNGINHLQGPRKKCCGGKCSLASSDRVRTVYDSDATIEQGLKHLRANHAGWDKVAAADFHIDKFRSSRASKPYSNAAHHLLACDVFTEKEGRIFNDDELAVMRALKYDVNWGKNVIFLPGYSNGVEVQQLIRERQIKNWKGISDEEKDPLKAAAYLKATQRVSRAANLHRLPCHWDYHPRYIAVVKDDMQTYKSDLQAEMKEVCETWNPPEALPDKLARYENNYWDWIVNFGKSQPLGEAASIADITGTPSPKKGLRKK